jgi:RNA 2',3'-cyclic 3'-phosphodiesterase
VNRTGIPPRLARLFVGIILSEPARTACANAAQRLRAAGFDAKYEDPNKLHVTLAFLGNVDWSRSDEIATAMRRAAEQCSSFELLLDKLGAFPHERRPRVVYVGSRQQGVAFRTLAAAIRDAYRNLGFAFDDDAVAHVTIARAKRARRPLPQIEVASAPLAVANVALFESTFEPEKNTSRYEIIARHPLGSRARV